MNLRPQLLCYFFMPKCAAHKKAVRYRLTVRYHIPTRSDALDGPYRHLLAVGRLVLALDQLDFVSDHPGLFRDGCLT
jgi:hypothetical protein